VEATDMPRSSTINPLFPNLRYIGRTVGFTVGFIFLRGRLFIHSLSGPKLCKKKG
jgi:hypothetical protein